MLVSVGRSLPNASGPGAGCGCFSLDLGFNSERELGSGGGLGGSSPMCCSARSLRGLKILISKFL